MGHNRLGAMKDSDMRQMMWTLAVLVSATSASAGIWENFYQGVQYAATPIGGPLSFTSDGTRINGARSGRVRIVPDMLSNGHRLEFDRTFGVDSRGRAEVFDLGPYELELQGSTQATLSYGRRGFLTGSAEFFANNLNYRSSIKTGGADAELTGTLSYANSLDINQFGFYTIQINISNDNAELTTGTLGDQHTEELEFDVGPITLEGNIFLDLFIEVLGAIGVDTSGIERLTPGSPADAVVDALSNAFQHDALVAGLSVTNKDAGVALQVLPVLGEATTLTAGEVEYGVSDATRRAALPEPATLVLLALGALTLRRLHRR